MDLFYQGTIEEQITALKAEVRQMAKDKGVPFKNKLLLTYGVPSSVGNCALLVTSPYPGGQFYKDKNTCQLINILIANGISNYFITYCYHIHEDRVSRKTIKDYSPWIKRICDAVQPRLIVCVGEETVFSFLKRKAILRDWHGREIDKHEQIPIMLTYPISYYTESSEYEDLSYKNFLLQSDWTGIKKKYDEVIS